MSGDKTNARKPYSGDRRALVLAFDVGTTFSGVSYAFLEPGEVPKTHGVTRYPGQEHVTGNTKIPSILYYDRKGKVKAAGAEAETTQAIANAEDEEWTKVELFKLRLRPKTMYLETNGMKFPPLPSGKCSEDVFGDFLRYLFSCTRKFIEDTHANGKKLWRAVEKDIHFVLTHPNGWEGPQQSRMRRAAISGGLIPDTDEGRARIRFVTEGEASMHACIRSGLAHDVLADGNGFIVADAGGGTLDVSTYILRGIHPLTIEEVAPPDCLFSGAVFVSRRCRSFLEGKLKNSKYGAPDTLDHITKRFDETTKRLFRDKKDAQYIPFGSPLDKDLKAGIRGGQLKLAGEEVAEFFEPSIQAAVASIKKQIEASRGVVKAVWLVGGFAASPWLFSQLSERLAPLGVTVNRPDTQTSKAVADGAIGFFCDHHVSARMSRYMYGVEYLREINVEDQEHIARQGRLLQLPSGPRYLPDAFDCILAKNVRVKESSVFSRKYYTEVTKLSTLSVFEIEIWCYRGGEEVPQWIDRHSEKFGSLCYVRADLSKLSNSAEAKTGANGQTYWTVVFNIEIHFGLTEFKARMKWNEDGKVRYGPASIVFNEKGVRSDEDDMYSVADDDISRSASPSVTSGSGRQQSPASTVSRSSSAYTDATTVETVKGYTPSSKSSRKSTRKELENAAPSVKSPVPSRTPSHVEPTPTAALAPSRTASTATAQPAPTVSRAPSSSSAVPPTPTAAESTTPSPTETLVNAAASAEPSPSIEALPPPPPTDKQLASAAPNAAPEDKKEGEEHAIPQTDSPAPATQDEQKPSEAPSSDLSVAPEVAPCPVVEKVASVSPATQTPNEAENAKDNAIKADTSTVAATNTEEPNPAAEAPKDAVIPKALSKVFTEVPATISRAPSKSSSEAPTKPSIDAPATPSKAPTEIPTSTPSKVPSEAPVIPSKAPTEVPAASSKAPTEAGATASVKPASEAAAPSEKPKDVVIPEFTPAPEPAPTSPVIPSVKRLSMADTPFIPPPLPGMAEALSAGKTGSAKSSKSAKSEKADKLEQVESKAPSAADSKAGKASKWSKKDKGKAKVKEDEKSPSKAGSRKDESEEKKDDGGSWGMSWGNSNNDGMGASSGGGWGLFS